MKCKILMPYRYDQTPETLDALDKFPTEWNGIEFDGKSLLNSNLIKARNDLLWGELESGEFDESNDLLLFWDSDVVATIDDFELSLCRSIAKFNRRRDSEEHFLLVELP